jgi:plastocyanin
MRKTLLLIGGLVLLLAAGIGGGLLISSVVSSPEEKSDTAHTSTSASHSGPVNLNEAKVQDLTRLGNVNVSIVGADFKPNNIHIKKGTKVTWTNNNNEDHSVMKENGENGSHRSVAEKDVKEDTLASPRLQKDKVYEFTFNTIGQVYYHCSIHPNIRGKITVVE